MYNKTHICQVAKSLQQIIPLAKAKTPNQTAIALANGRFIAPANRMNVA
ncbi:MAG: hypothetical protein HC903_09410 [Methylacidiphilales bacterium]|nr:hypothetical protein [Candidatus Methylacidiphilales bacterium]NJR15912.1 hypothetical protein [Calothrix sp. CSU_2_0]